jgi:hypothetical protein
MLYKTSYNAIFILFAMALQWTNSARAVENVHPLIILKCDTEADVLTITNSLKRGDKGADFDFAAGDDTYSLWDMVTVARTTDSTRIIKSTKTTNRCRLSSGEYTVILEPQIFSKDLDKQCGEMISGAVTVVHDGTEILERTAFEEYCHGSIPVITRITIFGKTAEYKIKRIPKSKFY